MKALLTGSTGFIGSNLYKMLMAQEWQVATVPRIETVEQNMLLIERVKEFKPDVVFHLASLFLSDHSPLQVGPLIASNLLFGTQVLEAAALAGVKRIINVGTSWQYPAPRNLYAATKEAFESILEFYCRRYGMSAVTLNLFDTYGLGDTRGKLVEKLIGWLGDDVTHPMLPKYHKIALAHVDDVCRAMIAMAPKDNLCWSMPSWTVTLKHLVEVLENLSQKSLRVQWGGRPYRKDEPPEPFTGMAPLDFTPSISLIEGLAGMLGVPVEGTIS